MSDEHEILSTNLNGNEQKQSLSSSSIDTDDKKITSTNSAVCAPAVPSCDVDNNEQPTTVSAYVPGTPAARATN
jgi:hypothetical protein